MGLIVAENTGLLGFLQSPEGQGLLSAAFGGMAGARRGTPWNNAGRAGLSGIAGYGNALDRQTQLAEMAKQNEVRDLQMGQMRRQAGLQQKQDAWRQQLPSLTTPQLTGTTEQERILAEQNGAFGEDGARSLAQIGNLPGMNYGVDQGKLNQHLMSPDSPFADKILEKQLFPPAADYKVVGNSLVKIDPTKGTAAPVFSEAKPEDKEPDAVRQYRFAQGQGYKGDFTSWLLAKQKAGAANTTIDMRQGSEEAKVVGRGFGEEYLKTQSAGTAAQSSLNRINRLGQLLEGVDTGKFAPLGLEVAKAGQALGLKIDPNVSNKEAAMALSNEIALQLRNPSGGAGMPGAMSDADRNFLSSMVPGIEKTPEGRRMIMESARKLAQRDIEVARMAREYRKKNGSLDEGFYDELAKFSEANPLFQQAAQQPGNSATVSNW